MRRTCTVSPDAQQYGARSYGRHADRGAQTVLHAGGRMKTSFSCLSLTRCHSAFGGRRRPVNVCEEYWMSCGSLQGRDKSDRRYLWGITGLRKMSWFAQLSGVVGRQKAINHGKCDDRLRASKNQQPETDLTGNGLVIIICMQVRSPHRRPGQR